MNSGLLFNLSLLVTLCVMSGFVTDRWHAHQRGNAWWQGLLFGAMALTGMWLSVRVESGLIFDGRSVILSLAAWHFGWPAALISGMMTLAYRLWIGGPGAMAGSLVIFSSCGLGLLMRKIVPLHRRKASLGETLGFGLGVHLVMWGILILALPAEEHASFHRNLLLPVLFLFPLATMLAHRILTDQKQIRLQYRQVLESEQHFRNMFERSSVVMLILDPETGMLVDANEEAVSFYGWPREDLLKKHISDINTLSPAEMQEVMKKARQKQQNHFFFRHRLATGEIRDVDVYSGPIEQEGRQLLYSLIIDMSGLRRSEEALRETLKQREQILNVAMNGFWRVDGDGHILEVNQRYCEMTGFTREELLAKRITDLDADETEEDFRETISQISKNNTLRMERRHRTKSGDILTLDVNTSLLDDKDQGVFCSFFRDVTMERNREQQMRLHSAALAAAANSVVITNGAGIIVWANEAFMKGTGYTLQDALGKPPGDLLKSGTHNDHFYQQMWQTIRKGEVWSGEIINRRKDGSLYEEHMTITPLSSPGGQIQHYIAIKQDISEQKNLERMFFRAQRVESLGRLSSGIAHDLNNILSPILMSADLLRMDLPEGPHKEMAELITESAKRGADVLRQLLAFARGTKGEKKEIPPAPLIRELLKMFQETFPREISIQEDLQKDLWTIHADTTQIHQLISNLMFNARDALPNGGELRVEGRNVTLTEDWAERHPPGKPGRFVRLSVIDNGIGMSDETMQKIFDPFFTTKSEGKGSGLGLATVQGILKGHGGFVLAESGLNQGSRFDVYLPALSPSGKADRPNETSGNTSSSPISGEGQTILVVDDEASVRLMLRGTLKSLGYQVELAENGRKGLEWLAQHPETKLMLMDYMMPEMNGTTMLKELDATGNQIPVLVISGMLPESMMREGHVLGRPILYKPFTIQELSEKVNELLNARAE